jgi:hypothetical protein
MSSSDGRMIFTPSICFPFHLATVARCADPSEHLRELVDPDPDPDEEGVGGYPEHGPEQQGRRLLSRAPSLPLPYLRISAHGRDDHESDSTLVNIPQADGSYSVHVDNIGSFPGRYTGFKSRDEAYQWIAKQ